MLMKTKDRVWDNSGEPGMLYKNKVLIVANREYFRNKTSFIKLRVTNWEFRIAEAKGKQGSGKEKG